MGKYFGPPAFRPFNPAGAGIGNVPIPAFERRMATLKGSEPDTLGALNGVPTYFRTNQIKDGIAKASSVMRGVPTELNRVDTLRNMGMTQGGITNAEAVVPNYRQQGYFDPQIARMNYGTAGLKNRKLFKRRRNQRKADNTNIIIDRPLG
jgi:hypothetical protein